MLYLDTETCGLVGPAVTIQYAVDDGDVEIYHIWRNSPQNTIHLIEWIVSQDICGFNLSFDWFHLNKIYNICKLVEQMHPAQVAWHEKAALVNNICLKPPAALDLMLIARQTKYQSTMDRKPVIIKRVPLQAAKELKKELDLKNNFAPIYFTRAPRDWNGWEITNIGDGFCDLRLRFFASSGLKALCRDLGIIREQYSFDLPKPFEQLWKPYGGGWPNVIEKHIEYWAHDHRAQTYAKEDVDNLRALRKALGNPKPGDIDSTLAIAVGCCRHHGFALDLDNIVELEQVAQAIRRSAPTAPAAAKSFIEAETVVPIPDTKKPTLARLEREGIEAAKQVRLARAADKQLDLFSKLKSVGRFHPDFKVIGTRSGRMSGGGFDENRRGKKTSINPQGIQRSKDIRKLFKLRDESLPILCGGDFEGFEVTIEDAVWNDSQLREDLASGQKIYNIFGEILYSVCGIIPDYHLLKTAFLGWSYGAYPSKLADVLNIDVEFVEQAFKKLLDKYPAVKAAREEIAKRFRSMVQPDGIGTFVEWHEPDEKIETLFGFPRYFTLENQLCKILYDLAGNLPKEIATNNNQIMRNKTRGLQSIAGACRSALYAAAFNIQSANVRQANNHVIQGTGAHITKALQAGLWALQPIGIHPWVICLFNIHDEIDAVVVDEDTAKRTEEIAEKTVEKYRETIPLLDLNWKTGLENWGEK